MSYGSLLFHRHCGLLGYYICYGCFRFVAIILQVKRNKQVFFQVIKIKVAHLNLYWVENEVSAAGKDGLKGQPSYSPGL